MDAKTLALYLGCECKTFAFGDSGNFKTTFNGIELRGDGYEPYVTLGDGRTLNAGEIKPLLRPLSSMTEEEKLKLYQFGFTCNRKGLQIEEPQKWHCFKPEQFQWLLSEGFDLFGLIEKGQAIDSTKL